jgi:hypothetical protein
MQGLTIARERIRAQVENASPRAVRLAGGLVQTGQTGFLPILSSALAQDILMRGYDARTLDRVYANRPCGDLGLVGRATDRVVLDFPMHQGLRERLQAAVGELCAAAVLRIREGEAEFRLLSSPCGLGAELAGVAERLRDQRPETFTRLRCWGVDPDPEATLLPEATRRLQAAGLRAHLIREDLRRRREVARVAAMEGPFHAICTLDAAPQLGLSEVKGLLAFYAGLLAPGGTLLVDRWLTTSKPRFAPGLLMPVRHHTAVQMQDVLRECGLTLEREHATGEGGCVVMVARKRTGSAGGN